MCFETTKSAKAKIAKEDIECWKAVRRIDNKYWSHNNWAFIPVMFNKGIPMVNIFIRKETNYYGEYIINEGYHSGKTKKSVMIFCEAYDWDDAVFKKFIIPKGTKYYSNRTQYVSETIMLVE